MFKFLDGIEPAHVIAYAAVCGALYLFFRDEHLQAQIDALRTHAAYEAGLRAGKAPCGGCGGAKAKPEAA